MEIKMPVIPFKPQWPKVILAGFGFLVIVALLLLVLVYRFPSFFASRILTERVPFPVVMIGSGVAVSTMTLSENLASVRNFYESQDFAGIGMRVDFSTEDGKKRLKLREKDLMNKMLEDKVIELLARERGISVTREQLDEATTVKMKELGTTDKVEETLARLYNWTIVDFQERIVRPRLYEEALYAKFLEEVPQTGAKERITEAKAALARKTSFADAARTFSDGQTKNEGGDLGWFTLEDLAPELRAPVDTAKVDIPTDIIESSLGYHIVLVEDSKLEENKRLYHLRQIFVRKENFVDWLKDRMREMPVSVLSSEYEWRRDEAMIEFKSEDLVEFEKRMRENAESDPTLIF